MGREFPNAKATSRSYKPGKFPQIEFEALNGATTAIRYGYRAYNSELTLGFDNIPDYLAAEIIDHYEERMQTFADVVFPPGVDSGLAGLDANLTRQIQETDTGLKWRYAEPPQLQSVFPGVSTVTCKFIGYLDGV